MIFHRLTGICYLGNEDKLVPHHIAGEKSRLNLVCQNLCPQPRDCLRPASPDKGADFKVDLLFFSMIVKVFENQKIADGAVIFSLLCFGAYYIFFRYSDIDVKQGRLPFSLKRECPVIKPYDALLKMTRRIY